MSGPVFHHDHKGQYLDLWYEDDLIALDTGRVSDVFGGHEIMLDREAVEGLIEALTAMQADITVRYRSLTDGNEPTKETQS